MIGKITSFASLFVFVTSAEAVTLVNGSLDGSIGIASVPTGWVGIGSIGTPDLFEPGNTFGYFTNAIASSDGGAFVSSVGDVEGISQDISGFILGREYTIRFEQNSGNHPAYSNSSGYWKVDIAGSSFDTTTIPDDSDWNSESFVFTANAATLTLNLDAVNVSGDINLGIDGISIAPVPEPSSVLLLGLGSIALLFRRKM